MAHCTYLLPIRRVKTSPAELAEFREYLRGLAAAGCEVIVIDGSPPEIFARAHRAWSDVVCRHEPPDRSHGFINDKTNGVLTGVALASHEWVILADDDIRYTAADVRRMCALLETHELVRPQNYLHPLPWWARMEAARMLINRATLRTGDYPGTCGFRRSAFERVGHYDGDVLFDNEELIRHFAAAGATVRYARDFFIQKRPPTLTKWREQRPRQAYEDFGMRAKTALFFSLLPAGIALGIFRGRKAARAFAFGAALGSVVLALLGRREGASRFFPLSVCLAAPLWIFERSLSTYWALWWKLRHGGYPFGGRLLTRGTGRDWRAGAHSARGGL